MGKYLFICRSLTYAQRTVAALERAGITGRIMRAPKSISGGGCSHAVKIAQRDLPWSLVVLNRAGLTPIRVYVTDTEGDYHEVEV